MATTRPFAPRSRVGISTLALMLCLGGCSTTTVAPVRNVEARTVATSRNEATFPQGPAKPLAAKALPFDLSVPEPKSFVVTETKNLFLLSHRASNTEIRIRFWSTSRRVTEAQCEEELALLDPEAIRRERDIGPLPIVASQAFTPGPDYQGVVASKVQATPGGPISGYVHGVAAGLGHCVSYDAKTQIAHANAEQEMADRLALIMDGIAASLRLRQAGHPQLPVETPYEKAR